MIRSIENTSIYVSDQDKALDFYVNKLGFEKRRDDSMGSDSRWVEVAPPGSQTRLVLYKPTPEAPGAGSLEEGRARVGKFTGLVLGADDVKRTYEELKAHGVHFTQAPEAQPWGMVIAQFEDQDGNGFVLVGPPPG